MLYYYVAAENALWRFLQRFRDERGQGTVEYGFLLAVIAIGAAAALYTLRDRLIAFFNNVASRLQ